MSDLTAFEHPPERTTFGRGGTPLPSSSLPVASDPPRRKELNHGLHPAARFGGDYFLTACCQKRNHNQLCLPEVATVLLESCRRYHDSGRWWCRIFLLMPDHWHVLVALPGESSLSKVVGDFNHITARLAGLLWQKGYFDHRLRHEESRSEKYDYILRNPVRAGLIGESESWPYVFSGYQAEGMGGNGVPPLPGESS